MRTTAVRFLRRVVLWTPVTPPHGAPRAASVAWRVARDVAMPEVVASGRVSTDAHRDYTVKVDVGELEPPAP